MKGVIFMMKKIKNYIIDMEYQKKEVSFWQDLALKDPKNDETWRIYREHAIKVYDLKKNHKICNFIYNHFTRGLK